MQINLQIPDEISPKRNVKQQILLLLGVDACKKGAISAGKLAEILSVGKYEIDGILKKYGVYTGPSFEDIKQEIGFLTKNAKKSPK